MERTGQERRGEEEEQADKALRSAQVKWKEVRKAVDKE